MSRTPTIWRKTDNDEQIYGPQGEVIAAMVDVTHHSKRANAAFIVRAKEREMDEAKHSAADLVATYLETVIANLGYPVGMGMPINPEQARKMAENCVTIVRKSDQEGR